MFDIERVQIKFKKIDFSDIRILAVGLVLLLVPVLFFFSRLGSPKRSQFGYDNARELIGGSGRGGFSFVQKSVVEKQTSAANLFVPPRVESQWTAAVDAITHGPPAIPDLGACDPQTRMVLEAQYNPDLRFANMYMNSGQEDLAIPMLEKLLDQGSDNPFLQYLASSKLCKIYEKQGKKDLLDKEGRRLQEIMKSVPNWSAIGTFLGDTSKTLVQTSEMMEKIRDDPKVRAYLLDLSQSNKMPQSPEMLQFKSRQALGNITSLSGPHPSRAQGNED